MMDYRQDEQPIQVPRFTESAGFYTSKKRRKIMSKIRAKNTKPEVRLRRALWAKNIRYRLHQTDLPGKPDIVIKKYKLAIFVDGEFWHGYDWAAQKDRIHSNRRFWIPKIERNMQVDRWSNLALRELGYTVFRFWSKDILNNLAQVTNQIELFLETRRLYA
ncbi:very short patch repair endonuclease [Sphingobacterium lactis]|nr:very short patch repair endonuclease [Sphingobacterium lactis]